MESADLQLHAAVQSGKVMLIKQALAKCGERDINRADEAGSTPLHLSSMDTRPTATAIVQLLLKAGADPNSRDRGRMTPLDVASKCGHLASVKILYSQTANARLHQACAAGHREIAKFLSEQGVSAADADKTGRTALHEAVSAESHDMVQWLLAQPRVDVNARDDDEETALHVAAAANDPEAVLMLLEGKADVHATDVHGQTAVHRAATELARPGIAEQLVAAGADVDAEEEQGRTALMLSLNANTVDNDMTSALLQLSADPNIADCQGVAPIHIAALQDDVEAVSLLISSEADVNAPTEDGDTALIFACERPDSAVASFLLDPEQVGDVDVSARNACGDDALGNAVRRGDSFRGVTSMLLDAGADPQGANRARSQ
jgi:ankyrin repeat protein